MRLEILQLCASGTFLSFQKYVNTHQICIFFKAMCPILLVMNFGMNFFLKIALNLLNGNMTGGYVHTNAFHFQTDF